MSLASVSTLLGLVTVAVVTMPFGIIIFAGLYWLHRKS